MVVYFHEAMCHAEKLVQYLQYRGHSGGFYNYNMTIFTISSKLLVRLEPNLVQHHKLQCSMEKWNYCIQGQGQSEGSTC